MSTPLVTGLSPVYFSGVNRQVVRFVLDKTSGKARAEQAELPSGLGLTDEKSMGESEQEAGEAQANELDGAAFLPANGPKWLLYDEQGQAHQFELDSGGILHESLAGRYAPMSRRYEPGKNLWVAESGKVGKDVNLENSALAHFPDRLEIAQFFLDRKKSEEALQEAHKAWRAALKDFPENSFAQFPPEPKVPEFVADTLKGELELSLMNSRITPSQYATPEAAYQDLWVLRHQFFNVLERSGSEKDLMKLAGDLYHYSARTDLNSFVERKPFESDENFRDRCQAGRLDFILSCLDQSLSAIEEKFPNEIAKTKAKLEAQGETSHSALDESLEGFIGKDGIYIKTVLDDTSISRDLKILYLNKAMTEEWPAFFESLDALYRAEPSNIELISALKSINDFCFNNDVGMGGDFGVRSQLEQYFGRQASLNFQIRKELMAASKKMVKETIASLPINPEEEKSESPVLESKILKEKYSWRSNEMLHLTRKQIEVLEDRFSQFKINILQVALQEGRLGTLLEEAKVDGHILKNILLLFHHEQGGSSRWDKMVAAVPQEEWVSKFNLNAQDDNGQSLLFKAVNANDKEAVLALIAAGIDVDLEDNNGYSALLLAAKNSNFEIFCELALASHVPNPWLLRMRDGPTAFEILSGAPSDYDDPDEEPSFMAMRIPPGSRPGYAPLQSEQFWNLIFELPEHFRNLLKVALPIEKNKYFSYHLNNFLLKLPSDSLRNVFKKLLECGLPLDWEDKNGRNFFQAMAKDGRWDDIIALIKENNIPKHILEAKDAPGLSLLHLAILAENEEAVSMLISAGVDLNVSSSDSDLKILHPKTPLSLALEQGKLNIAHQLQEAGAKLGTTAEVELELRIIRSEAEKFLAGLKGKSHTINKIKELFPTKDYLKNYDSALTEKIKEMVVSLAGGKKDHLRKLWKDYRLEKVNRSHHVDDPDFVPIKETILLIEVPSVLFALRDYQPIHPEALRALLDILKLEKKLNLNEKDKYGGTALGYLFLHARRNYSDNFKLNLKTLLEAGAEFYPDYNEVSKMLTYRDSTTILKDLPDHLAREFINHHPQIGDLDEKGIEEGVHEFFKVLLKSPEGKQYCDQIQAAVIKIKAEKKNNKQEVVTSSTGSWWHSWIANSSSPSKPSASEEKDAKVEPRDEKNNKINKIGLRERGRGRGT